MRIGIDLGGTKIEGIVLDRSGDCLHRIRVPSPRGDYDKTVTAIVDLVGRLEAETGKNCPVGLGIPGTISRHSGLVKNANSTWLIGQSLQDDLEKTLSRPVRIANDANCFALSEASDGAAAGEKIVMGAILGTGVGAGVVVAGAIIDGPNGITGEWGHNPMPWPDPAELPGPPCYCGKSGCIETFLSGPGLLSDARLHGSRAETAVDVVKSADAADQRALERYEARLAKALASVINVLDPDVIVLGGGMSNVDRLYTNVPPQLERWVFSDTVDTRIVPPRFGDSSGVRGAAWLWPDE